MAARILVADDSVTIQKVVELTFSKENFVLVQARSGEEAIRKAKEVQPDLVLLDLVMPDKNGYEVCAALRADPVLSRVPIILLTGTFDAFDKDQGIKAGANDFVTKPFESQLLISKVKQLLFAKTVEMGAPTAPAPPKEAPRPAPAVSPPPPGLGAPSPFSPGAIPSAGPARAAAPTPPPVAAPPPPPQAEPVQAPASLDVAAPPRPASPMAPRGPAAPEKTTQPVPTPSPRVEPMFDLPPPTEEISQDRLWQALDSTPAPGLAGGPDELGELSLEDLSTLPLPPSVELPPLELDSLEKGPTSAAPQAPVPARGAGEKVVPLPESLSLEELLSPGPAESPLLSNLEPAEADIPSDQPVFDLTAEMDAPSLPLVEVGLGEPPSLSVEDLLRPVEAAPADTGTAGPPELDLESLSGLEPMEAPSAEDLSSAAAPLELEAFGQVPLEEAETIAPEASLAEVSLPAEPLLAPPLARPLKAALPEAAPATPPGGLESLAPDMAGMRQAVTERVAHELARELGDKLVERIERIVWEVVPDLAEILITKEIERIRALAEGKQSS